MAEHVGKSRLKRKTDEERIEARKETKKKFEASSHHVRLTSVTYERWNRVKDSEKLKSNDSVADFLLDLWEHSVTSGQLQKHKLLKDIEETPGKSSQRVHSTPTDAAVALPSVVIGVPVSDISNSEEEGPASELSGLQEMDSIQKYVEKAKETDGSFINISFDVEETEKDRSYRPTLSEEEEAYDTEETDTEDEDIDYTLDMSLRLNGSDMEDVPVQCAAEAIFDIEETAEGTDLESDEELVETEDIDRNLVKESKAICFERNLISLSRTNVSTVCNRKGCGGVVSANCRTVGTLMRITWKCSKGHVIKRWNSQPLLKKKPAGDFLLSSSILSSGNNFEKVRLMFHIMNLGVTSKTSHYQYQSKHCVPVIKEEFERMMAVNRQKYVGQDIIIAGDGRMDSPGHSAQYCTYTVMEYTTKDILACEVVNKRETAMKSTAMEKEGLKRCLIKLKDSGLSVKELCTDASTTIAAMIERDYSEIQHSFDTWHGAKNFGKRLGATAAETKNKELRPWVPHIINHFWYCSRKAEGDEDALLGKWRGLLHHVVNVHEWALGECEHGQLVEDEGPNWLEPGESPQVALTKLVLDTRFLHSLRFYVNFRHTGDLETFHEHILMYCAKRFAYTHPVYKARNYLAVIDYQHHKNRPELKNKKGETRLHRVFCKKTNNWTCYTQKTPKKYEYIADLLRSMIEHFMASDVPLSAPQELSPTDPRKQKRTLAPVSPPPTRTLFELKKSRFEDEK